MPSDNLGYSRIQRLLANNQFDALFHVFIYFVSLSIAWYAGQEGTYTD